MQARTLAIADSKGLINWNYGAIDGSSCSVFTPRGNLGAGGALFPPGKGGGEEVAYGGKGKGVLIHTLTEGNGMPLANCTTAAQSLTAQVAPQKRRLLALQAAAVKENR